MGTCVRLDLGNVTEGDCFRGTDYSAVDWLLGDNGVTDCLLVGSLEYNWLFAFGFHLEHILNYVLRGFVIVWWPHGGWHYIWRDPSVGDILV